MSNYYEYSLAKRMYEKIEDTLTKVDYEKDKLITLKEIREILKKIENYYGTILFKMKMEFFAYKE